MNSDQQQRLEMANAACQFFCPETIIKLLKGRVWIHWTTWRGVKRCRMWMTRGNDFYAVWHNKWGHGGTRMTALAQLVRFVRGLTVLPIGCWEHWCSDGVRMVEPEKKDALIALLSNGGYPLVSTCIFCGKSPIGRYDWYDRDNKLTGTGCLPMCPESVADADRRSKPTMQGEKSP